MTTRVEPTFEIKSWDEQPWHEAGGGRKLTQATVTKIYHGPLEATGTMHYVMAYADEGTATYVGLELVDGMLDGRTGTFVLKDVGGFEGGIARPAIEIVEGSGSGELGHLRGTASVDATKKDVQTMTLDYDLA